VAGEITTSAYVDFQEIVRATINEIGYNRGNTASTARPAPFCRPSTASRPTSRWAWTRAAPVIRGLMIG